MSNEELIAFLRKNVISVSCVIASLLIGLTLYYRSDNLPDAEKVLGERQKEGELLAANIEDGADLKEQYTAIVEANQAITDRMMHIGQLAENNQYFYRLESETGAKLSDPHQIPWNPPAKTAAKTSFVPIGFTLTAQGEYGQLLDLLRKLEKGDHYCRVISCSMRPLGTDTRGGPLLMTLSLELLGVP
jgi:hypothetical protein